MDAFVLKCRKCGLPLTPEVIVACGRLTCPNKQRSNTSGKVDQLFVVDGEGFAIDGVEYISGEGSPSQG
jgi:hypothetical protein